jgi:hypothetical protein
MPVERRAKGRFAFGSNFSARAVKKQPNGTFEAYNFHYGGGIGHALVVYKHADDRVEICDQNVCEDYPDGLLKPQARALVKAGFTVLFPVIKDMPRQRTSADGMPGAFSCMRFAGEVMDRGTFDVKSYG